MGNNLIPNRTNYRELISYKKTLVIYDITYYFVHKFLEKGDRTIDQMIQAARSGKQNIVEGCSASATSSKTEIKLLNVAKASLQELLIDYEDFLRVRGCKIWDKDSIEVDAMRKISIEHSDSDYFINLIQTRPPETIANMVIVLIRQADYLLYKQLQAIGNNFIENGGFNEKMYKYRKDYRDK